MKSHSERRNKRRYCRFHREYDHDTEECRDLQYQIEDLIRRGHLCRYVRDQSSLPDSRPPRDSSPRPKGHVEKQIEVIFRGPASGDDSSSTRKAYARSEVEKRPTHDEDLDITFKSGGEEYPCHDDALVVSIQIGVDRQKSHHSNIYLDRVHRGLRLSLGGDHDFCHVRRRTKVKDSYGVYGGKAPISVQRYHRAPDPQPAQGGHLDLSPAPKVPDPSRGWRGQE
ncbi:hypothetical protein B296_00015583 [Ensete ventricosum]|uniref:Uncharacterized protein n=1 Tax=Ensete ventricosum TaxID=4639 RepID=A0A427AV31_ENSVE|nr:hypothetical protein B296_00015583 [Ensete ventricosum]